MEILKHLVNPVLTFCGCFQVTFFVTPLRQPAYFLRNAKGTALEAIHDRVVYVFNSFSHHLRRSRIDRSRTGPSSGRSILWRRCF
jgi:hypothetical protein